MKLSPGEKARLLRLREERGWSYSKIATEFGMSRSGVEWQCLTAGVVAPQSRIKDFGARRGPLTVNCRDGRVIRRFTPEEDAVLLHRSLAGETPADIARSHVPKRRPGVITYRLLALARMQELAEAPERSAIAA